MKKRIVAALMAVMIASTCFTACGSSSSKESTAAVSAETAAVESSKESSAKETTTLAPTKKVVKKEKTETPTPTATPDPTPTATPDPTPTATPEPTPEVVLPEIFFRDIPWGTSFAEVDAMLPDFDFFNICGENFKTYSKDDIIYGDYNGLDFSESGFNMISSDYGEHEVAGYITEDVSLYFALQVQDGVLNRNEGDAVLYGARYQFESRDFEGMTNDLIEKLTATYGEPTKVIKSDQPSKYADYLAENIVIAIWEGSNATLSLRGHDYNNDEGLFDTDYIYINYASNNTDDILKTGNDAVAKEKSSKESANYGNSNTSGL